MSKEKTAKDTLKRITRNHLEAIYDPIEIDIKGRMEYWIYNGKVVKPYFYADRLSTAFIETLSESNINAIIREHAHFMGVDYYGGQKDIITIYYVQPELLLKHYVCAGINKKAGTNSWHIRINHEEEYLIFKRSGDAEDVYISIDTNNYYIHIQLTDDEYEEIDRVLHRRNSVSQPKKKTLKLIVETEKGRKEFSKLSIKVLAILSILTKSNVPLDVEQITSQLITYDVVIQGSHPFSSVQYILKELGLIDAVALYPEGRYALNDKVNVIVDL